MTTEEMKKIIVQLMAEVVFLKAEIKAANTTLLALQSEVYPDAPIQDLYDINKSECLTAIEKLLSHEWFTAELRDEISEYLLKLVEKQVR